MVINFLVPTKYKNSNFGFVLPKKIFKKTQSKAGYFRIKEISFTDLAAQTTQIVKFMLPNVAYRPTVYKTGLCFCSNIFFSVAACQTVAKMSQP